MIYVSQFPLGACSIGPVPLANCGNGSGVNSPTAVSFTVLSQTPRRPSYGKGITTTSMVCPRYLSSLKTSFWYLLVLYVKSDQVFEMLTLSKVSKVFQNGHVPIFSLLCGYFFIGIAAVQVKLSP